MKRFGKPTACVICEASHSWTCYLRSKGSEVLKTTQVRITHPLVGVATTNCHTLWASVHNVIIVICSSVCGWGGPCCVHWYQAASTQTGEWVPRRSVRRSEQTSHRRTFITAWYREHQWRTSVYYNCISTQ